MQVQFLIYCLEHASRLADAQRAWCLVIKTAGGGVLQWFPQWL